MRLWALLLSLMPSAALAQPVDLASQVLAALTMTPAVVASCPSIEGVLIGDPNDRSTWLVQYVSDPSPTCQGIVNTVITSFAARPTVPTTMQLASTGTPSLNGTYATDATTQQQIAGINLYLLINGNFPTGQTSQVWPDTTNTLHTFDRTHWLAFAKAMADFMFAEGSGVSVPQPVTIP